MSELVERLREADCYENHGEGDFVSTVCQEAADRIEELERECATWQEASGQANVRAEQLEDRLEAAERERDELLKAARAVAPYIKTTAGIMSSAHSRLIDAIRRAEGREAGHDEG